MPTKNGRGFAGMDPKRQKEIASLGGKAAHKSGNAHEWSSAEARKAGRLGGIAAHQRANTSKSTEGTAAPPPPEAGEAATQMENKETKEDPKRVRATAEDMGREHGSPAYGDDEEDRRATASQARSSMTEQDYR